MQMTHYDTISFRPHPVQFVINELPLMSVFLAVVVYGGMEDMPFGSMAAVLSALVFLILLYRYIYLRRIRYDITAEQLCLRARDSAEKGGLYGTVPHRGLSGETEYSATAVRTENSKYPLDGPEHAKA